MDRRGFIRATGVAVASPFAGNLFSSSANAAATWPALMKVGTQHGDSDAILRALAGFARLISVVQVVQYGNRLVFA